jgi:hypothetical protein
VGVHCDRGKNGPLAASPVGPVSTDPTIAAVSTTAAAGRQRRPRPDRIDLDDGDYLIPDQVFRAQFMAGATYRTGKRADERSP